MTSTRRIQIGTAVLLAAVAGCSSPTTAASPSSSPSPSIGAVAFVPLAPTGAVVPQTTIGASPDPSLAQGLPPCLAGSLHTTKTQVSNSGTAYLELAITSSQACRLSGRPSVTPLDSAGAPLNVAIDTTAVSDDYAGAVALGGTALATLRMSWSANWCAPPITIATLRLGLPDGGGSLMVAGFGASVCYGVPGSGTTAAIDVHPFAPKDRVDGQVVSIFHNVRVVLSGPSSVPAGGELAFTVELTAPAGADVPLAPCPDYRIMFGGELPRPVAYALNCAGVPYRDGAGRPYLPGGMPVVFAMRVAAPSTTGAAKLTWQLATEDTVSAGQAVDVV